MMPMEAVIAISGVIGVFVPICTLIINYFTFWKSKKKENEDYGKQYGMMFADIGYIKSGVDDIKSEQREQRNINVEVLTRMTAVESSTKQAHRRIDRLENKSISESERRD